MGWSSRPADTSILYRSRHNKGLQLTSISLHYKKMQLLKMHTVKYSGDSEMKSLYQTIRSTDSAKIRVWKPSAELEKMESIVDFERKFSGQSNKAGLGFTTKKVFRNPVMQHRRELSAKLSEISEETRLIR